MKLIPWISSALTVLALACLPGLRTSALADTTNILALTTFDADGPAAWGYGYYYGDDGLGYYEGPDRYYYDPYDYDFTNAMCRYVFDLSNLVGDDNYGTGFGAPQYQPDPDPALFVSSNRADYIFSFDARVEGLLAGQTTANLEMQAQFLNSALTPNNILQVNLPFAAGVDWANFRFMLDAGGFGANTSDATFAQGYDGITGLQWNVNSHVPSGAFDFDGGNAIVVDNLKLEVIVRPPATNAPPPTVAVPIADWNCDDKPIWYTYQYAWTESGAQPIMTGMGDAAGYGVGGGNAWILQMDNSAYAAGAPAWAGGGTGGEGACDFSQFNTGDLAAYRLSVDSRVEGLALDRLTTTCVLQVFLRAPDDTLSPADADSDRDLIVQLNFALTGLGADWQTLGFKLSQGSVGGGSKDNFTAHFNKIDQLATQWQIENAASVVDWDFDNNNVLVIDNFKTERVYEACPPLVVSVENDELVVSWGDPSTGTATLQSATQVGGPYSDVTGAANPYRAAAAGGPTFYRTMWIPPIQ